MDEQTPDKIMREFECTSRAILGMERALKDCWTKRHAADSRRESRYNFIRFACMMLKDLRKSLQKLKDFGH